MAGVFGGLPNTSFSQNVGIVGMTGVMSRHVVTIGAIVLVVCGLIPKIGAIIAMIAPIFGIRPQTTKTIAPIVTTCRDITPVMPTIPTF